MKKPWNILTIIIKYQSVLDENSCFLSSLFLVLCSGISIIMPNQILYRNRTKYKNNKSLIPQCRVFSPFTMLKTIPNCQALTPVKNTLSRAIYKKGLSRQFRDHFSYFVNEVVTSHLNHLNKFLQ